MLPEVSQFRHIPCCPPLGSVMSFFDLPYPAGAVESLKEVIVLHVFELLPGTVSLRKV